MNFDSFSFNEFSDFDNNINSNNINTFTESSNDVKNTDDSSEIFDKKDEEKELPNAKCDIFKTTFKKDRGKQSKISRKRKHMNNSFDNMQTKIQVHYISFIINLSNDALYTKLGVNTLNFKDISYEKKQRVNQKYVEQLKKSPISEVLKMNISKKYKKYNECINNETFEKVCELSDWLKEFYNINYLVFFKYYYNNKEKLKKITFEGKEIILSKETKSFADLLEKNKDIENDLVDTVKSVYFSGYDTLIGNKSFLSTKKEIELIE